MIVEYLLSLISLYLVVAVAAGIHVLLYKRDSKAALGWLGMIVLFPYAGVLLYVMFGVNRVRQKARRLSLQVTQEGAKHSFAKPTGEPASMAQVGYRLTHRTLSRGIAVNTYYNGEEAYPPMLKSIDDARHEVLLSSYIFDNDRTGREFVTRLAEAQQRGVKVSILVDDVGIRYSFPSIIRELKRNNLPYRRFMPLSLLPPSFSFNLRTHRKLLIADRRIGFAGGMNIGDRQLVEGVSPHRASDLHFGFEGLIVNDFAKLFSEDWEFCGGSQLKQPQDMADHQAHSRSSASCRLIADGPDENLDALMLLIIGVISRATKRVWIMSPYFLPEQKLAGCLQAAALSGVDVRVMIPQKNNFPVVQWALQHNMTALLESGVTILQRPPPFAHSKCLMADDDYALVGSSNLDPRSLRLNFELGVEVFDRELNKELCSHFESIEKGCVPFTREKLDQRGMIVRLRDSASAMFAPYL